MPWDEPSGDILSRLMNVLVRPGRGELDMR